jgi:hypothetical protein
MEDWHCGKELRGTEDNEVIKVRLLMNGDGLADACLALHLTKDDIHHGEVLYRRFWSEQLTTRRERCARCV